MHTARSGANPACLAQVEGALKNASFKAKRTESSASAGQSPEGPPSVSDRYTSFSDAHGEESAERRESNELIGLGRFETLPPTEMIEDLHDCFFDWGHPILPMRAMIHKDRYLQAYYSSPHKRPPMCLQYAIWTMAASRHEKYGRYHEALYRRARQYLEADELKGSGEDFVTIGHAQAWALLAVYEGGCMQFSRVAMSSAKCARLVQVMGLHRLDEPQDEYQKAPLAPALPPAQSWVELEERRRVFWCAFSIDGHSSISTGWPSLMDLDQITTHLPASEEAFETGKPESSSSLQDVFKGAQYSTLAGVVVNCHIFKVLLSHIHRFMPDDRPQDVESGPFWVRHRYLDHMISSTFMFLPERFKLPKNLTNPIAVRAVLNLHGSAICLHNSAWSTADRYNLPESLKTISKTRSLAAAEEIVGIVRLVRYAGDFAKRSLTTPSLYCAAAAFIHQGRETPESCAVENLEFILECIEFISQKDLIARAYLNQLVIDIQDSGLSSYIKLPDLPDLSPDRGQHIPLLARGTLFSHQAPRPPRLPFSKRTGNTIESIATWNKSLVSQKEPQEHIDSEYRGEPASDGQTSKRKRTDTDAATSHPPFRFTLADNWFAQCAPLHFDPMTFPSSLEDDACPIYHENLTHRGSGLSSGHVSGPAGSHLSADGQPPSHEDFLMSFASAFDESSSVSPNRPSPTGLGEPSNLFPTAAGVHGYSVFGSGGNPGQLGMGLGADVFPGLDSWEQMTDVLESQQQRGFDAEAGADPWAVLNQGGNTGGDGGRGGGSWVP